MSKSNRVNGIYGKVVKRGLDCIFSLLALIVLSPFLLITALLVRVKLGSPVIFKQDRPGRYEKIFKLYKFRSMSNARGQDGKLLPDTQRLTKFGRILRATSLDELPELFNILKGDMSIVGPRPLAVSYLPYYTNREKHRHDVRPGLTGLAQVSGRNSISWDSKFKYDIEYIKNLCFINDVIKFFHFDSSFLNAICFSKIFVSFDCFSLFMTVIDSGIVIQVQCKCISKAVSHPIYRCLLVLLH